MKNIQIPFGICSESILWDGKSKTVSIIGTYGEIKRSINEKVTDLGGVKRKIKDIIKLKLGNDQ